MVESMKLAKSSSNGQITVLADIRRLLNLKSDDKILLFQNRNGEGCRSECLLHQVSFRLAQLRGS